MNKKLPGLRRTRRPSTEETEAIKPVTPAKPKKKRSSKAPRSGAKTATSQRETPSRKNAAPRPHPEPNEPPLGTASPVEEIKNTPDAKVEVIASNETTPIERDEESRRRHRESRQIISLHAAWSSAGGLIPLPYADMAAVSGIQIRMVMKLADLHGAPFSRAMVKAAVASVVGGTAPHAISVGAVSLLFKSVPGVGTFAGMAGMAGLSYPCGKPPPHLGRPSLFGLSAPSVMRRSGG